MKRHKEIKSPLDNVFRIITIIILLSWIIVGVFLFDFTSSPKVTQNIEIDQSFEQNPPTKQETYNEEIKPS